MTHKKSLREKSYPKSPGVYFFKDAGNSILYIGKAKNLKNRISSYFSSDEMKVLQLLQQAVDIEFITTNNEIEALFLEAQLIKKHQPPFNRLLKTGNPFVYIFFSDIYPGSVEALAKSDKNSSNKKIPTISMVRTQKKKGEYFGPFLTKTDALNVINYLKKRFQLNICGKKIESGCLQYHIGICAGSCKSDFDDAFYNVRLNIARQILQHKYKDALAYLESEIKISNQNLNFERSQHLTQYHQHLAAIVETLQVLKKTKYTNIKTAVPVDEKSINPAVAPDFAKASSGSRKAMADTNNISNINLLSSLKKRLGLKKIPYTIDCFDISHMQSQSMVGSCVRFLDGKPDKKNFRHFMIKSLVEQNDYAALAEIVARRYRKVENYPDLIIIDGGKGQLSATKHLAGPAEIISISKGENRTVGLETVHFIEKNTTIDLDIHQAADRLLLQIRDYAHHFAISYHRKKQKLKI